MPDNENNSVGSISLDLVIKNTIEAQLERIKQTVSAPAEKVGRAIEEAVEKPVSDIGSAVSEAVSEAAEKMEGSFDHGISDAIEREMQRLKEQQQELLDAASGPLHEPSPIDPKQLGFDQGALDYMDEYEQKAEEAAEKISGTMGEGFAGVGEAAEQAEERMQAFERFEVNSDPVVRLWQEIGNANTKMELLQKKWQELSAAEPTDKVVSQLVTTEQQIMSTQDKLDKLWAKLGEAQSMPELLPEDTEEKAEKAAQKTEHSFENAFKKIKSAGAGAFKAVHGLASKSFSGIGSSAAAVMKPVAKLGKTLKNTFRRVFLMAGIYAAFRAVKDGFGEAVKADEQFSKSLNEVKANLAIAFTPIMNAVMPMLNTLMSGLSTVTKQTAAFISGLFGMSYKQAAEATKKLRGVSDAAKKASLSTAGIDEMNILGSDDKDDSDSGIDFSQLDMTEPQLPDWAERLKQSIKAGDWSGVGTLLAERVNAAFSAIPWDTIQQKLNTGISKLTDLINGFAEGIDPDAVGDTIAGSLNTVTGAVNTFFDGVNWGGIGKKLASSLNRAIQKTDWKSLGKALSQKIRAFIDLAFEFVSNFDFGAAGDSIGEAFNSFFENIDFAKAGKTLSGAIKGLLDLAIHFIETVDWRSIGGKIAEFIANIDWSGIVRRAFELLGAAIGATVSLLWGAIRGAVTSIRDYFAEKIEESGGNIIEGLWNGIVDALSSAAKWIKDNIFKPFINGFKKAFGIASPSKEMASMGGYIIDGLKNGISDRIDKIKEVFTKVRETIEKVFSNAPEWFSEKFGKAKDKMHSAFSGTKAWFSDRWADIKDSFSGTSDWFGDTFSGARTSMNVNFTDVGDFFKEQFSTAWDNIKSVFSMEKIGSHFSTVMAVIKGVFNAVGTWFKDKFQNAYDLVTGIWDGLKNFFSGLWDDIKSGAVTGLNGLLDKFEEGLNWLPGKVNSILQTLTDITGKSYTLIPEISIPRLASGGLATAPTLAMVGDNRNARSDPEVIAPLSKLSSMLGGPDMYEVLELLRTIVELLRNGISAELIGTLFGHEFRTAVLRLVAEDNSRKGAY